MLLKLIMVKMYKIKIDLKIYDNSQGVNNEKDNVDIINEIKNETR